MDQLNLERLGIPTVTIITNEFRQLAQVVASSERVAGASFVVVPHPMGMIPRADIIKKAEESFKAILEQATVSQTAAISPPKHTAPAGKFNMTGTVEEVNRAFFERGWSLGLPVIPPSAALVEEMLAGTKRRPDEVLGEVPPVMGTLTVELVAANAAMAGGKPEHMPLLIAALEGLLSPEVNWRGALATTGTTQTLVVVNGPVVKKINLGYGQGAAGKGHQANAAIGYAINLIAYNVGGSRPPSVDKSTLASPADYVCWVFGENEEGLPAGWKPLHVKRGFKEADSVVTVMTSYPPLNNIDHWSVTAQEHVRWWRYLVSPLAGVGGPCSAITMEQSPILALGPEHAQLIASAGWTKLDFQRAFWEQARIPLSAWPDGSPEIGRLKSMAGMLTGESMIPITLKPEQFITIIAGGAGKHSHYFPPFPASFAVSRLISE